MDAQSIGIAGCVGRGPLPVLESIPVAILMGTLLGFLSGLGIGGGSLLILWLTVVLNTDPSTARNINLLFFLPSAVISCTIRIKQGNLRIKKLLPAIIAGCISAAVCSVISVKLNVNVLKKLFGIVLLATGLRELFYRPRNAR